MEDPERDALLGKVHTLERQLAQAVRKEIDIERESQDALAEAESFRSAAQHREQALLAQLAKAKLDHETLAQDLSTAKRAANSLQSSSGQHDQALQQKQNELMATRETNRQLDNKVEQLQSFLQEQAASNKQARTAIMELTRERGDLDMRAMRAENQLRQCQHAKQNTDMDKEILQKDVASVQQQLAEKREALRTHWTESNAKVHALEHQLQESSSQRQVLQASHEQLQQQKDRLMEQLRKAQSERQSTKTHLEQRQTMFEQESSSLHSALSRQKEERAAIERDKQALHSFVQELTKKAEDFKHEHEQAIGQLQQQLSSAKHGLSERDEIIERFKQVSAADAMPSMTTAMYENQPLNTMSPGPAQNGSSPVQAYSKYVALSHEHNKLKREYAKLQGEWEQFEQAVIPEAQKAKQLARRNVDLDEANAKLSAQVQVSNEKAKRCLDSVHKWQGQFDDEKAAHGVTRKLLKEAQHQVALLANENRQLNGIREQGIMPAWSSGLLEQSLVQFKDVQGLVTTNETLRRLLHEQQLKAEQQMKHLQLEVQNREKQIIKGYEEPLAAARQQNAEAMARMQLLIQQRGAAQKAAREAQRVSTPSNAPQLEAPQRQKDVCELEQELARLKHEGEAYRDDLKKQLEGARQAAMQARHEAGQAHARAVHEASLVQQLQEDKQRLSDIVDSWKKQGREQQELISGLNRRLDQLQNHASRSQDESGNLRQRVAVLNAQNEILQKDNQRLLHESTEHSTARWQLVAQRDTQSAMNQQQQERDAHERARLHSELSNLQRNLAEVQRQLADERSSRQHSFSSVQTVQEAADARLVLIEQSKDKLQATLSEAQSQLAVSEAKVTSLQASVQQAEARASALDLQLKPKASSDSGAPAGAEQHPSQSVAALRKELQEAQSQAAEEACHVAQFKSLAESAEENTSIVQAQYERLKAEAEQNTERLQQAESKLEVAERDLNSARQSAYEAAQTATRDKQQAHSTITNLQAEIVIAKRHAEADASRHQKTVQDLATRSDELRQAQSSYNKSVLEHAETVKKLSEQETHLHQLQLEQTSHMASKEEAYRSKAAAELAWQKERVGLQEASAAAQRRLQDVEKVNAELQGYLDRTAQATAGQTPNQDGQLAGLVQHLQMRHRTLDGENQSLQQLIARLKADLEATNSRANEAERARLEAAERLRDSLRSQEHQQRLMQQVQELNLLRESNVTLRRMSEQHRREAEAGSQQVQQLQAELEPLSRRANELQAAVDSHQEDNVIHEEAMRHAQKRISDLLHKADAVDKAEHERVTAALKATQEQLAQAQAEVEQLRPLQASVNKLTGDVQAMRSNLSSVQAELASKQAQIDKTKTNVSLIRSMVGAFNPENLSTAAWTNIVKQKLETLRDLTQAHSELQKVQASSNADNEQLRKDLLSVQAELTQLQQEASAAGASSKSMQAQQQALQSSGQTLQLRINSMKHELEQKSTKLEQSLQQQRQLQEQLDKANAALKAASSDQEQAMKQLSELKMQLDSVNIDVAAKSAQLETALKSMEAAQSEASASGQDQQVAAQQQSQELLQKELQLQQAQAALQQEQSQVVHQKQLLQQQQQHHKEHQQQLQQQQQALKTAELELQKQVSEANAKAEQGAGAASQVQGSPQVQHEVQQLQQHVAEMKTQASSSQAALKKAEAESSTLQKKLRERGQVLSKAQCIAQCKDIVVTALSKHVQELAAQLKGANLPVPAELDIEELYKTNLDKYLAEKGLPNKRADGTAKAAKQAAGTAAAQRARGAASSSLQPINTARAVAKQSSPAAAPTAEELAVRQAALASLHKGQESSFTTPASPRQPQATPILRLRPTVQQVTKRERSEPVLTATGSDPPATATEVPAAKRVKADGATAAPASAATTEPKATSPSPAQAAPAVTLPEAVAAEPVSQPEAASAMQIDVPQQQPQAQPQQQQAQQQQAQQEHLPQQQQAVSSSANQLTPEASLSPLAFAFLPASSQQGTAPTNVPESVARVAVVQHDRIEVRIQAPGSNAAAAESMPAEATTNQPESQQQSPPTQATLAGTTIAEAVDVAMTDPTLTVQVGASPEPMAATKSQGLEEDAEQGQVSDAGGVAINAASAEHTEELALESEPVAATPAGQDEAADADGAAAGNQKRKAIVFQLPPTPAVEIPAPTATGQEQQSEQQQTPGGRGLRGRGVGAGGRGGTAAGNSVRSAARGGQRGRTGRGSR